MKLVNRHLHQLMTVIVMSVMLTGVVLPVIAQDDDASGSELSGLILFARYDLDTGDQESLILLNVATGEEIALAIDVEVDVNDPVVSPDGTQIAFFGIDSATGTEDIFVMNVNGTGFVQVTTNPALDYSPAWSPDGERLVFISERDDNAEIYTIRTDGTDLTRLTFSAVFEAFPTWSPDGTLIAFSADDFDNNVSNVYTITVEDLHTMQLTSNDGATAPAWSPDGEYIAFDEQSGDISEIYVMTRDGEDQQQVTELGLLSYSASWSTDSSTLSFVSVNERGDFDIYAISIDGTGLTRLTDTQDSDEYFAPWVPLSVNGKTSALGSLFDE